MDAAAPSPRRSRTVSALAAIMLLAFALRFWNADFCLPHDLHPDEAIKFNAASRILDGKPPGYFRHPGLLVNTLALSAWVRSLFQPGAEFDFPFVIYAGRVFGAFVGALTVLPMWWLGRLVGRSNACGIVSALLLAVVPLHVVFSRYVKEDTLLCFGMLSCIACVLQWRETPARRWIVLLGVAVGFTIAAKFAGALVLPFVLAMLWRRHEGVRPLLRRAALVAGLAVAMFCVLSPQVFFLATVASDLRMEGSLTTGGRTYAALWPWQWPDFGTWWLRKGIVPGLSAALALACGAGIWLALRKDAPARPVAIAVLAFVLFYYVAVEMTPSKIGNGWERYVLPIVLVLVPFGAFAVLRVWPARPLGAVAAAIVVLYPAGKSAFVTHAAGHDTHIMAAEWLAAHEPDRPYAVAYLQKRTWEPETPRVIRIDADLRGKGNLVERTAAADAVVIPNFHSVVLEEYPRAFPAGTARMRKLREAFPHGKVFARPDWMHMGFNNSPVEILYRDPAFFRADAEGDQLK